MASPDAEASRVRSDIERHGWHVALVPGEGDCTGWSFTIGLLQRFDHPEIAVFGPDLRALLSLTNRLGLGVRQGRRYQADAGYAGVLEGFDCVFRTVAPRWIDVFFGNAAWHYARPDVPFLQCFWPDAQRRFPWEPGFDPAWRPAQPLLYHEDAGAALPAALRASLHAEGALPPDPERPPEEP